VQSSTPLGPDQVNVLLLLLLLLDFKALVKHFLGIGSRVHIAVVPLGLDAWAVRAGFTYWVVETRQMGINITDTAHGRSRLKVPGNATIESTWEILRDKWNTPAYDHIMIRRADDTPFWIEDKGDYVVTITYDASLDTRKVCTIKVVCSKENQIYLIEDYRVAVEDPTAIWTDICSKYGFVNPGNNHLRVSGNPDLGLITYTLKLPTSVLRVQLSPHISRTFKIIEEEEEWNTGEILSPKEFDKEQVWDQI
jgi:hypothetical protein